ncbi:TATA box-binding protein-associated factor RNA polymerase I subunit B [Anabrus simplex]|uniref:TATA box-binding protein-associated factor RNA polymerase I subunit B n=1 Tax=Anabrus simplex TaxID=316456 RepID=UPI0034DD3F21
MNSEKKNVQCVVCGGTEYVKEIGFYYCVECQTQSQELREEVFDLKYDASGIPLNTSTKTIPSVKKSVDDCVEWTTWEAFNFILRGQVEELMSMGASEKFKYTVLQLWAHYLSKLEVAFTSQSLKVLPKIGPSYHEKDRNLVYGTPAELRKSKRKKHQSLSDADSVSTSFSEEIVARKRFRQSKRALVEVEKEKHTQNLESSRDQSTILDLSAVESEKSNTSIVRPLRRTVYSKAACKVRKSKLKTMKWTPARRVLKEKRLLHYTNPNTLSRFRLLVLLHIALLCSRERIQLSDILRWVREGHLAYYEISHLLPSNYCIKGKDHLAFSPEVYLPSYSTVQKTAKKLAKLLNVSNWMKPNLLDLTTRFLKELQLPAMFLTLVERFMVTTPSLNAYDQEKVPNFEVRVMAIIIIILKLLLGLDGKTEDVISSTASKINSLLSDRVSSQLFVWRDWVQFIVCRKALVVQYHFPTRDKIAPEVYIKPQVYINCWEQLRDKCGPSKAVPCRSTNKLLVNSMKQPFLKLKGLDTKEVEKLYFPPTLTPYYSYVKEILSFLPNGEVMTARNILSQDFTSMDLEYLLRPAVYLTVNQY